MKFEVTYRQIWQLAYPIIAGAIAHNLINVVNTFFLAQVGEVELGAAALGGILYYVMVFVGAGLGTGAQILVARRTGEGNDRAVGPIADHTFALIAGIGVVLFIAMQLGVRPLLEAVVESAAVREATATYLDIRSYEIWFALSFWVCRGLYTGLGRNRIIIVATAVLATVHITMDYCLIFGNWGFPRLGIKGAGYATLIAEAVTSVVLIGYFFYGKYVQRYGLFQFKGFEIKLFKQLSELSAPIILQNMLSMGAWFVFFVVVEHLGQRALAASNLIRSVYMVAMIPTWGLATAANAMVSNVIGQGKRRLVGLAVRRVLTVSLSLSAVIALLLALLPRTVLELYTSGAKQLDPQTLELAVPGLMVVAAILMTLAAAGVLLQATTGTGATRFAFLLEVGLIGAYLGWVFLAVYVFKGGLTEVWMAEGVYFLLMALGCGLYLRSGRWRTLQV